jgi:excinuclease ABC subunit A
VGPEFFMFNAPESACRTCSGLGTYNRVHPDLLVPDRSRSIVDGAFVKDAWNPHPDNWDGRHAWSLAAHYGFSLEVPFAELPPKIVDILFWGTRGEKYTLLSPPGANPKNVGGWSRLIGKPMGFDGVCARIERSYKHFRQRQTAESWVEQWLTKLMVEHTCPDCGGTRLRASRQRFRVGGKTLHEVGQTNFSELRAWLGELEAGGVASDAGRQVLREVIGRLDLLLGIGLDYLNFNRRSATLSGGEAQRIRLSTQIGSGLMACCTCSTSPPSGCTRRTIRR